MSKLRFKISMSLDGFVAGPDQSVKHPLGVGGMKLHEWVFPLVAFRRMHGEQGGEHDDSNRVLEESRRAAAGRDVSLAGGARAAQQYLPAGLVDEMQIHLVPTLLGSGERLFDRVGGDLHGLALVRTVITPNVTHLKFARP